MIRLFVELSNRAQRGSKPRCHLLTHGAPEIIASRLTSLVAPFATVSPTDHWMPCGFADKCEAELDKAHRLLDGPCRTALASWWLPPTRRGATTPNWDIASTCTIDGRQGLLLIEAKAHDKELTKEASGRHLPENASDERRESHPTIGAAIQSAREGLIEATGLTGWGISRDDHYQISNRFAWGWKLAELGVPVVLVYLGFLDAAEMADRGMPLANAKTWSDLVLHHSKSIVPSQAWEHRLLVNGTPLVPLIRSTEQRLERRS
ncbi:MAG: hypothetical protein ACYC2K_08275 [Gemmatimonadales bacterium]